MSVYSEIAGNKRKSWVIVGGFFLFTLAAAYVISRAMGFGPDAVGLALIVSGLSSIGGYYFSDSIVLGMSGARPANREKDFHFYTVTENLCLAARLPMPKLYVIEDTAMNAFATGRDPKHAVVCATSGLLTKLDRTELEGVVAHELAHVRNYDMRLMSIVAVMVGLIALMADFFLRWSAFGGRRRSKDSEGNLGAVFLIAGIVLSMLSPLIAQLIQLSVSRSREYLADASAAKLTGYPEGLARALEKLSKDKEPLEVANKATAHLYISNPLKNHHDSISWFAGLFNTHPPIEERIAKLRNM